MTIPEPVERCGYTITPVLNRDGSFNGVTGNMRITKDKQWAVFPARLWAEVAKADDAAVLRVLESLFYQPEEPTVFTLPEGTADRLIAHSLSAHIVVSREDIEDGDRLAAAFADMMNRPRPRPLTDEEREANRARHEAERSARLAGLQAEWQALRDQYRDVPALLAVLDVHQPSADYVGECAHPVFGWEADAEEWPCSTIEAIKGAAS